ncbi:MAG TPA: hypothetical protein EYP41_02370 [Anaerolineae bacterium]|nr:hypothetical protein [Anaerolineae bacterium]
MANKEIPMSATIVMTNGRIHTMDPANPLVTAVAIRGSQILAVGSDEGMKALLAPGGEWIDLHGCAVTPGLIDAHVHFQWFSLGLQQINLDGTRSLKEALQRIQTRLNTEHRPLNTETWLRGRGWRIDDWPSKAFPTAAQLDTVVPDRPAFFNDKSGHAAWVNSRALRLAGNMGESEAGGKGDAFDPQPAPSADNRPADHRNRRQPEYL